MLKSVKQAIWPPWVMAMFSGFRFQPQRSLRKPARARIKAGRRPMGVMAHKHVKPPVPTSSVMLRRHNSVTSGITAAPPVQLAQAGISGMEGLEQILHQIVNPGPGRQMASYLR